MLNYHQNQVKLNYNVTKRYTFCQFEPRYYKTKVRSFSGHLAVQTSFLAKPNTVFSLLEAAASIFYCKNFAAARIRIGLLLE